VRITKFSFIIPLIFNQANIIIRYLELIFAKYTQYLSSLMFDIYHFALWITHLLAFLNVSHPIFVLKCDNINS
jgi:hypothetical protein